MVHGNVIRLLFLSAKLLKFEIQKCGQILCVHKPYFLMPGHKLEFVYKYFVIQNSSKYQNPRNKTEALVLFVINRMLL